MAAPIETNLTILNPSRKRLHPGDIFVLKPKGFPFYFGRVVRTDAQIHGVGPCVLIYVYNDSSDDKLRVPDLDKSHLLVPPTMTNRLPWSRGYFETVYNRPLTEADVLQTHCFFSYSFKDYHDEHNHVLPERVEPCGEYGLHSFRTIDDEVSKALGIPLVPD